MKAFKLIITLLLLWNVTSCSRNPSTVTLKEFPHRIRYEKLPDINDGIRVLTQMSEKQSKAGNLVVPGDVLWCEMRGKYIIGEKAAEEKPAPWLSPEWEKSGFFMLDPTALTPNATSDDKYFGNALKWFENKEALEKAIAAASGQHNENY